MNSIFETVSIIEKDKLYCDPDFSIKKLAEKVNIPAHKLLTLLDEHYGFSFFDKINQYRVDEAKNLLADKKSLYLPMEMISFQSGFKSIARFNQIFTQHVQMSPFQYKISKNRIIERCYNIGVLIDNFYSLYESEIFLGIRDHALRYGNINLFCFLGGSINSPRHNYSERNQIFQFATKRNLDGIVSISSSIGNYISHDKLVQFFKQFQFIPLVNIGERIEGMSGVYVDNKFGMTAVVEHLIREHNCKKIAFITGPPTSTEANQRLEAFKEVLGKYNLPVDESLIVEGNFLDHSGRNAVKALHRDGRLNIDAIVAANDYMAINVIFQLNEYGINVPEDILVTGYDNITDSQFIKTPLTTVAQPCYELGFGALELLMAGITNKESPADTMFSPQLIIRNSCGCGKTVMSPAPGPEESGILPVSLPAGGPGEPDVWQVVFGKIGDLLRKKYTRMHNKTDNLYLAKSVFDLIYKYLKQEKFKILVLEITQQINIHIKTRKDLIFWYDFIYITFDLIISREKEEEKRDALNHIYKNIIYFLDSFDVNSRTSNIYKCLQYMIKIGHYNQEFMEMDDVENTLIHSLPYYGINSFCISVFSDETRKSARTLINYNVQHKSVQRSLYELFPAREIIPGGLRSITRQGVYVVMPMLFRKEALGTALFECNLDELMIFELIITQISNSIKNLDVLQYISEKSGAGDPDQSKSERMTNERAEYYFNKLIGILQQEKNYLDPVLNLQKLAVILNISRNDLSYIINTFTGYNFYDFINSYRVEETKKFFLSQKELHYNILDIAFESGFNSKSTFNRVFKRFTNKTPSQFMKEARQKIYSS